ncbi:hypothetical protein OGAPHI_001875 [Ogataea philodendri]|uniref:Major facilitator superfamily (MFS) profile domain-containing protein n=1 Tax=Ogataea philodendri TaxID=1378263 RepID=A0A9P8T7M2_9ASCO|nr:uncharacterized protein OGAPHI_001875 [Ogataea philodendri]KAH3668121.1 hypothetical protein OGAPHI_001875 [Ogataea philodendri]
MVSRQRVQKFGPSHYRYDKNTPLEDIPDLKSKYGVILLPQPSNSVNDPFNWPQWRKGIHFFLLILITAFTSAIANDASAPQGSINTLTGISYDALNNSAGLLFVSIALSTWLYAPLASLCGRKVTYLLGLLFALAGSIWYAKIQHTGDAFGSQILVGFAEGATEAQVQLSLSSIFFRHQLGAVVTIYILATAFGTYLGPLAANLIARDSDFRWVGWSGAITSGILLLIITFVLEEDYFDYTRFAYHSQNLTLNQSLQTLGITSNDMDDDFGYHDTQLSIPQRRMFFPALKNYSVLGFLKKYVQLLISNINCLWFPPVLFAGLIWGFQDAILTFYLTTQDTALYSDPFNYSDTRVALMNVPCLIGSFIGCIYAGSLTDYFVLWVARKNNGIVESEFRLFFAFLSGIIGSVGLLMFGFGVARDLDWRIIYVGLGMISYLYSSAGNLAMLYVIGTYDQLILETLVAVEVINNLIGCIFTFACSPWLDRSGTENTYIALAVLNIFFMFLSLPLLKWGKSWRLATKKSYVKMVDARSKH